MPATIVIVIVILRAALESKGTNEFGCCLPAREITEQNEIIGCGDGP
jgi:hypothetical protein